MRSFITSGIICLQDDYKFVYRIARIDYTEWENGRFKYSFYPYYNVIDILPDNLYQGIPGLDLSLRRACYERENIVPVFISERTPAENREDLWQLMEESGMQALNRLEWLIRTDTRYSSDRFFVKRADNEEFVTERVKSIFDLVDRSDRIIKKLLQIICYGDNLVSKEIIINDDNRLDYYRLLMTLYVDDYNRKRIARLAGIKEAKKRNAYCGRAKKSVDPLLFQRTVDEYYDGKITATEAAKRLNISKATFYRRLP